MLKRGFIFCFVIAVIWSCNDKVTKFNGFTQKELEFLLASEDLKVWERVSREEDGVEVEPDDCGLDNFIVFVQNQVGQPKPLLYAYNPTLCDSLEFCNEHPNFCISDTTLCNADPAFCQALGEGVLYIGTWYAKEPFVSNDRSDTLIFEINNIEESIHVTNITSQFASFLYKNRSSSSGGVISENYQAVLEEE